MDYDLELQKIVDEIKKARARRILLQLPDGLKKEAKRIVDFIKEKVPDVEILIWLGSCYGSCDLPLGIEKAKIDLLIHFGHTRFIRNW